jgi:hypothetical protein
VIEIIALLALILMPRRAETTAHSRRLPIAIALC